MHYRTHVLIIKEVFPLHYTLPDNSKIAAIQPEYTAIGDRTLLFLTDGTQIPINLKVATIIRRLANRQTIDLCSLKNKTAKITKCTLWHPLVLAPDLVLVPLKIRKPRISGDVTSGYINFHHIITVQKTTNDTCIKLIGNHEIHSLWKTSTVHEHMQRAQLAFLAMNKQNLMLESLAKYLLMSNIVNIS